LFSRKIEGGVTMLNLLCFKEIADYSAAPELTPGTPITGKDAFRKYIEHTNPFLKESGGELLFYGDAGKFLIGPRDERWDFVMLVRQKSLQDFLAFSSNKEYLAGLGHRTAALEDSRLLPIVKSGKTT